MVTIRDDNVIDQVVLTDVDGNRAAVDSTTKRLKVDAGPDVTFQTPIVISQSAVGRTTIMALEADKVIRLHEFVVSGNPGGTYYIAYDNDGAGTAEVALTGAYPIGTNGGIPIPFRAHPDGCLKTVAGKQLTVVSAGGAKLFGHAIVSKASS